MGNWKHDDAVARETAPEAKMYLSLYAIIEACEIDDVYHNVDFTIEGGQIQSNCRWEYSTRSGKNCFEPYWSQFLIRSERPCTGHASPLDKILSGENESNLSAYYWVSNATKRILCMTLIDLTLLRPHLTDPQFMQVGGENKWGDGSVDSKFKAYSIYQAANRGCIIFHRYAKEAMVTPARLKIQKMCTRFDLCKSQELWLPKAG